VTDVLTPDDPALSERDDAPAERRRSLRSLVAALLIHAMVLAAFALGIGALAGDKPLPPVTIELQSAGPGSESSGAGGSGAGAAAAASVPAAPATAAAGATVKGAAASGPSGANDFVIPTPRSSPGASAAAGAGPAFREAGGKTGVVKGIPSTPSSLPGPDVAPVQQGRSGSGSGSSSGSAAASVQRSGTGVAVGGSSQASGGSLDLSKLDKALASGGSAGGAAGSGTGGSGGGAGGGSGSGSGSGTAGGGAQSYSVVWGVPSAGKGRTLVSGGDATIPAWVEREGLELKVTVSFTLLEDGIIAGVAVQKTSGYPEVDNAVMDAIRRWRFTAADHAPPVKGVIPYVIRPR
jgi:TonB family protein